MKITIVDDSGQEVISQEMDDLPWQAATAASTLNEYIFYTWIIERIQPLLALLQKIGDIKK